ncbi:MAG: NADPH-dependent glutamate synthase [Deltaproteobacteria bacterium]|jgi:glutamate synthase (NADPH/NADH) small chain|nr:NADPH-dependent glutamate synthase [Deltaproteobacteria bacterium]
MPCQSPEERIRNFGEVALGYTPEMAMAEARRCLRCPKPKCVKGCPVEVRIRDFILEILKNDFDAAYEVIKATNALPAVCGRVCPQEVQCEGSCVLAKSGRPIAIGRLERFAADRHLSGNPPQDKGSPLAGEILAPEAPQGPLARPKVACVGSGPSSLTVAGDLIGRGVEVTVFEALHRPGGVLIYGIPEFRLPKSGVVDQEIELLRRKGVKFETNVVGGRTVQIEELLTSGYSAVFLGVGAGLPIFLSVPGESLIGVVSANEYLTRANLGQARDFPAHDTPILKGSNATVYGAGNVAMDAARVAKRLGARKVTIVYRRTKEEMPCRAEELEHALEEGVEVLELSAPIRFLGSKEERLEAVELQHMEPGPPDESGRRRPVPVEGKTSVLQTDLAVIAVGTRPNPILMRATPALALDSRGYIKTDDDGETSIPGVFAGGDIVTGSATVILAMGAGRRAAKAILRRLGMSPE